MTKTISFNDLRRIKDSLPDGSIRQIEPGPNGGIVVLDDTTIYDMALEIIQSQNKED